MELFLDIILRSGADIEAKTLGQTPLKQSATGFTEKLAFPMTLELHGTTLNALLEQVPTGVYWTWRKSQAQ